MLELIIVLGITVFWMLCHSLIVAIVDKYSGEGIYVASDEIKKAHYFLKKSKFLFWVVFVINRKWKKGMISKFSFWATIVAYIYYFFSTIIETVFLCFNIQLRLDLPLAFVCIWIIIPMIITICSSIIIGIIQRCYNVKQNQV